MTTQEKFWETKKISELNRQEWESLCDGCGYCCLVKLEDEDDGHVYTTNIACRLLDTTSCRCQDYENRQKRVSSCLVLNWQQPELFELLPETCAYRCLFDSRPLPDWHPLLSGDSERMLEMGVQVCEYAISEEFIHPEQAQDHVIHRLK